MLSEVKGPLSKPILRVLLLLNAASRKMLNVSRSIVGLRQTLHDITESKCSSGTRKPLVVYTINKTVFQAFYVEWLTTDYQCSNPVYLGVYGWCWLGVILHSLDSTAHIQGSGQQDDVPSTEYFKSLGRTYIHDTVFEGHRCLVVSVIPCKW